MSVAYHDELAWRDIDEAPVTPEYVWLRDGEYNPLHDWALLSVPMAQFKRRDRARLRPGVYVIVTNGWCRVFGRRISRRAWRSALRRARRLLAGMRTEAP